MSDSARYYQNCYTEKPKPEKANDGVGKNVDLKPRHKVAKEKQQSSEPDADDR